MEKRCGRKKNESLMQDKISTIDYRQIDLMHFVSL